MDISEIRNLSNEDLSGLSNEELAKKIAEIEDTRNNTELRNKFYEEFSADTEMEFPVYSERNMKLVSEQMPNAIRVAGKAFWEEHGYTIAKNAKGVEIIAPQIGEDGNPVLDEKGSQVFTSVTVFDISEMESKRLGMCSKSLIVVPNHLTEQMGAEFMRLYPSANILVATKKDFEAQNRRRLCSKIATGDYDAVIIGHSQLEKIPISQERQERYLKNQISDIAEGIKSLKRNRGDSFSIKRLEVTKKNLESKLKKLTESKKRDDVVTFEELGIDKMYIDEAHNFKNLFLYTKMRNVAGIQQTEAQKSSDLYLKCQYLNELTDGKGTVFATGTPVAGLQQLNTKFNFNSVFVGNPHDLNHSRGYLALFFKR